MFSFFPLILHTNLDSDVREIKLSVNVSLETAGPLSLYGCLPPEIKVHLDFNISAKVRSKRFAILGMH